ncbi:MAG TPA: hypothetical protein VHZ76_03360 [Gammaproteobacteria bacterium]|jgi:hypothetical protein|nr:hypothetical protein [Gammaproteobacteria bacterium]
MHKIKITYGNLTCNDEMAFQISSEEKKFCYAIKPHNGENDTTKPYPYIEIDLNDLKEM